MNQLCKFVRYFVAEKRKQVQKKERRACNKLEGRYLYCIACHIGQLCLNSWSLHFEFDYSLNYRLSRLIHGNLFPRFFNFHLLSSYFSSFDCEITDTNIRVMFWLLKNNSTIDKILFCNINIHKREGLRCPATVYGNFALDKWHTVIHENCKGGNLRWTSVPVTLNSFGKRECCNLVPQIWHSGKGNVTNFVSLKLSCCKNKINY